MLFDGISRPAKAALGVSAAVALTGLALFVAGAVNAQAPAAGLAGIWIDHTGRGAVEMHACGNQMCGRIAWLKEPNDAKGAPMTDKKGRPLCGLQIIGDLKPTSNAVWSGGWIYDPDKDDTFDVELTLKGRDRLQVLGYMGVKFLSETYVWKRAPEQLAGCGIGRAS